MRGGAQTECKNLIGDNCYYCSVHNDDLLLQCSRSIQLLGVARSRTVGDGVST